MTLMAGHIADVREAASYAPKETMPMSENEMSYSEAANLLDEISTRWVSESRNKQAFNLAIAALRAQPEPGPRIDDPLAMIAALNDHIAELNGQLAAMPSSGQRRWNGRSGLRWMRSTTRRRDCERN